MPPPITRRKKRFDPRSAPPGLAPPWETPAPARRPWESPESDISRFARLRGPRTPQEEFELALAAAAQEERDMARDAERVREEVPLPTGMALIDEPQRFATRFARNFNFGPEGEEQRRESLANTREGMRFLGQAPGAIYSAMAAGALEQQRRRLPANDPRRAELRRQAQITMGLDPNLATGAPGEPHQNEHPGERLWQTIPRVADEMVGFEAGRYARDTEANTYTAARRNRGPNANAETAADERNARLGSAVNSLWGLEFTGAPLAALPFTRGGRRLLGGVGGAAVGVAAGDAAFGDENTRGADEWAAPVLGLSLAPLAARYAGGRLRPPAGAATAGVRGATPAAAESLARGAAPAGAPAPPRRAPILATMGASAGVVGLAGEALAQEGEPSELTLDQQVEAEIARRGLGGDAAQPAPGELTLDQQVEAEIARRGLGGRENATPAETGGNNDWVLPTAIGGGAALALILSLRARARSGNLNAVGRARLAELERQFGPLTEGEQSGNIAQRLREDDWRRGIGGDGAASAMRGADYRRAPILRENAMGLVTRGEAPVSADVGDAGRILSDDLRTMQEQRWDVASELYDNAFAIARNEPIPRGINQMPSQALASAADEFMINVPDRVSSTFARLDNAIQAGSANHGHVERARQELQRLRRAAANARNDADEFVYSRSIDALDEWHLNNAPASPAATQAMRDARTVTREIAEGFGPTARTDIGGGRRGRIDLGGRAIDRMINADLTGEQVIDTALGAGFGRGRGSPGAQALGATRRLNILGTERIKYTGQTADGGVRVPGQRSRNLANTESNQMWLADHPAAPGGMRQPVREFQALREGAWQRVLQPLDDYITRAMEHGTKESGFLPVQRLLTNVDNALNHGGREIMEQLYTPRELTQMRGLIEYLQRMVPPPGAAVSGTTPALMRAIGDGFRALVRFVPFLGPLIDGVFGVTGTALREAGAAGAARRAVRRINASGQRGGSRTGPLAALALAGGAGLAGLGANDASASVGDGVQSGDNNWPWIAGAGLSAATLAALAANRGKVSQEMLRRARLSANDRGLFGRIRGAGESFVDQPPMGGVRLDIYPERLWQRGNPTGASRTSFVNAEGSGNNWNLSPEEQFYLDSMSPLDRARALTAADEADGLSAYERRLLAQSGGLDTPPSAKTRASVQWGVDNPVLPGGRAPAIALAAGAGVGGALAIGAGEAQAQDDGLADAERLATLEAETQELQGLLAEANRVGRTTPEGRALITRAQEFLQLHGLYRKDENGRNLTPDGVQSHGTQMAIEQFLEPRETEMADIRERRIAREHDAALRDAGRPEWWSLAREGGMLAGGLAGVAIGLRGRARAVADDVARQVEANKPINALVSDAPIPPGATRAAQRQRLRRVSQVNEFWERGGAGARQPFQTARTPEAFSERPRAADTSELYPPPQRPNRFRPGSSPDTGMRQADWGRAGQGVAEAGGVTTLLVHLDGEIARAEREYEENPTPANLRELERLRDIKSVVEAAARAGIGYAGGRLLGARQIPYTHVRPNVGVADQTRYALQDYLNTSKAARRAQPPTIMPEPPPAAAPASPRPPPTTPRRRKSRKSPNV